MHSSCMQHLLHASTYAAAFSLPCPCVRAHTRSCTQVVVMTHAYGDCGGVRYLTNGLKARRGRACRAIAATQ